MQQITSLLPEFDAAYVEQLADRIKRRLDGGDDTLVVDLSDVQGRFRRIAGLVEAAYLCEGSITHGSGDQDAIEDYFTAISGTISVAASECRRLLKDVDGEGGGK